MRDALGLPQSVLVLGAGSDIAAALLRRLMATRRLRLAALGARRPADLGPLSGELAAGGVEVVTFPFDADDTESHPALLSSQFADHGPFDVVLIAFGLLGDSEADHDQAVAVVRTNMLGAVSAIVPAAELLRRQGQGRLVVLSSLGAERPRASNAAYGASKAGLDAYCLAMGDRLAGSGVGVMVVRPGFVHTKMTAGRRALPMSVSPESVADAVVDGLRRDAEVVWVPRRGRWAMLAVRHLPRAAFRRLPA
ncbi:MAG: SDR family NAD(P)-dependent oxidoreductase [Gaiellales bacterium]